MSKECVFFDLYVPKGQGTSSRTCVISSILITSKLGWCLLKVSFIGNLNFPVTVTSTLAIFGLDHRFGHGDTI